MSRMRRIESTFQSVSVIDSLIQPLIGKHTSVKCIEGEDGCEFVRDAILLLNKLDIEHPVGEYIVRVCNGFITQYRTGGDNLLFFICEWTKAASLLCQMGLSIRTIITLLKTVVDDCVSHAETHSIHVGALTNEKWNKDETVVNDCVSHAETHSIPVGALTSEQGNKDDSHEVNGAEDLMHGYSGALDEFISKENYTNQPLENGSSKKKVSDFRKPSQLLDSSNDYVPASQRKSSNTTSNEELKKNDIDSNNCIEVNDLTQIETETDDGFVEILIKPPTFGSANNIIDHKREHAEPLLNKSDHLQSTTMTLDIPKVDDGSKGHYSNNAVKEVTSKTHTREKHIPLITQTLGKVNDKDTVDEDYDDEFSWFLTPDQSFDSTTKANDDQFKNEDDRVHVPVIHLKRKNTREDGIAEDDDDDDDDISWFFTSDKSLERREKDQVERTTESMAVFLYHTSGTTSDHGHTYNAELAQYHTKGVKDALNASSVSHDKTEASVDEMIEDNDNNLIKEINDLKINIENDLRLLKNKSLTNGFVRKTEPNLDKRDSDGSEDEFCHCWDDTEISRCETATGFINVSDSLDDDDDFITVQFTLDKKETKPQMFNINERNTGQSSNGGVMGCQRNGSQTKELKQTSVTKIKQEDKAQSTAKDIKKYDTLLKSLSKKTKNIQHSGRVLNNSRHFRTFRSIRNQGIDIVTECDGNDEKSSNQECLGNTFLKGNVKNNHVNSSGMDPCDSQKDILDTNMKNKEDVKLDLQVDHCKRASTPSLVGTITPDSEIFCEDDPSLKRANISEKPQTSLSDMNALLDKLNTFSKHSINSNRLISKNLQDNKSRNVEIEKPNESVVCKGHGINLAVSVRSRHLNTETILREDQKGINNINPENNEINSYVPEDQDKTETCSDKQSSKCNLEFTNTTSDLVNKTNIPPYTGLFSDDEAHNVLTIEETFTVTKGLHSKTFSSDRMGDLENSPGIIGVVEGLLERADKGIVKVICDVVSKLDSQGNLSMLDKLTDCYPISGFKTDPRIVKGLVLKTSFDCVSALYRLKRETNRVLLVNADITPLFRHKGYKSSSLTTNYTVDYFRTHGTQKEVWTQEVTEVLTKLNLDVILARGRISEEVFFLCDQLDITAIEQVPYKKLKLLSDLTETDMAVYVKLATEDNVCSGVRLSHISSDVLDKKGFSGDQICEIVISLEHNNPQTVVLSELTPVLVDLKEQEFWECFHRVTSCLQAGVLLPGNSQTEVYCMEFLRNKKEMFHESYSESQDPNKYCLPLVYETIEQSFHKYVSKFRTSAITGKLDWAYDDPVSKFAAWRKACDTVCTLLNLEYYIITGITAEMQTGSKHLTL